MPTKVKISNYLDIKKTLLLLCSTKKFPTEINDRMTKCSSTTAAEKKKERKKADDSNG